jgi:hypothetical protein
MRFRKLRIAWSVVWGVACLLLCVLWVRSYWYSDVIRYPLQWKPELSAAGTIKGVFAVSVTGAFSSKRERRYVSTRLPEHFSVVPWLGWRSLNALSYQVCIPIWLIVLPLSGLAAVPWIHWSKRFSLRTLLIATTLAAVVLGLIVYFAR